MSPSNADEVDRYADMLGALAARPRLRILRLLLAAHPHGLAAGDLAARLAMTPSTLSHHLERLKRERLVIVRRERTFLWYSADRDALQPLLKFLRSMIDER